MSKDIAIVAKDAVFLISLATEEFIRRIVVAGQRQARGEHRATVKHQDLASVVRRIDEFMFLEGAHRLSVPLGEI
jgi:DNA polymerase epsilon subunit 4